jgi:flagellar basal-body rod modification protein FlgD
MSLPVAANPPTPSTTASSGTAAATTAANASLQNNQQMFLTLLTAQLKNQDPLSPMDPTQFTQQLVTMNGVQQQIMTNQLLQQLVDQKTSVGDPVNMIGKTVTAETPSGAISGGGNVTWGIELPANAKDVSVQVTDSNGQTVAAQSLGAMTQGDHQFTWNGTGLTGQKLADGIYTLNVTAKDATGASLTVKTFQTGVVSSVETVNGQPMVDLNGMAVPMANVVSVSGVQTAATTTNTTISQAAAQAAAQALSQATVH